MCTIAGVVKGIAAVASVVVPTVKAYNVQKDSLNYRTTIALNNMKEAREEAYAQKQLGIEEARKQKIEGLRHANAIVVQNAASGFVSDSGNNLYTYEDSVDDSYQNAMNIQKTYNVRADNYFEKARSYLNEAKEYQNEKKDLKKGLLKTALGGTRQVASKWYTN